MARRKAPCIANDARTKTTVAPPGAPLPERFGEAKKATGAPRAANNRGDSTRLRVFPPHKNRTRTPAMYDIRWIRENPEAFDRGLIRRGLEPLSGTLLPKVELRNARIRVLETWQARRNEASQKIGQAKKAKDDTAVAALMAEVAECKQSIATLEAEVKSSDDELNKILSQIPNTPLDDVPDGADEHDNVILSGRTHAISKKLVDESGKSYLLNANGVRFTPKQHFELGEDLKQMDFETAAKLSGARFVVLQKGLARLERALGQFFLDTHTGPARIENGVEIGGYTEVNPPLLVRDDVMFGTAQLPKFAEDQFETKVRRFSSVELDVANPVGAMFNSPDALQFKSEKVKSEFDTARQNNRSANTSITFLGASYGFGGAVGPIVSVDERLWLIPTAEVSLTNLVREAIVAEDELPLRLTACTPCFRAEAGAAGRDTRGMIRQHQFTKVELVSITTPEKSREEHERMLACAEAVLKKLDLHYRVVTLCTGDMGFASQKTYDIEVWLPGQNMYREISSCSVCGDFQARRMNARFRDKDNKVRHVHTLNGSGVAVGRALIAVMETYQQDGGAIAVPEVLKPYMGGVSVIEKK